MNNVVALKEGSASAIRAAGAKRIRELEGNWTENTISLGEELNRVRETFPTGGRGGRERPGWVQWVKQETHFSASWASRLIQIASKFGGDQRRDRLPAIDVLKYLARDAVPQSARDEVVRRTARGEKVTKKQAKKIIEERLPSPMQANKQAKETGKPVPASDGYVYFGADKQQMKASEERRTVVYAVRDAIETLASLQINPTQFLSLCLPHQLWTKEEQHMIFDATKWLVALSTSWRQRQ